MNKATMTVYLTFMLFISRLIRLYALLLIGLALMAIGGAW